VGLGAKLRRVSTHRNGVQLPHEQVYRILMQVKPGNAGRLRSLKQLGVGATDFKGPVSGTVPPEFTQVYAQSTRSWYQLVTYAS
jgi:hypothetical protein